MADLKLLDMNARRFGHDSPAINIYFHTSQFNFG